MGLPTEVVACVGKLTVIHVSGELDLVQLVFHSLGLLYFRDLALLLSFSLLVLLVHNFLAFAVLRLYKTLLAVVDWAVDMEHVTPAVLYDEVSHCILVSMKVLAEPANHVTILGEMADFQEGFVEDKASRRLSNVIRSTDPPVRLVNHELIDPVPRRKLNVLYHTSAQIYWHRAVNSAFCLPFTLIL